MIIYSITWWLMLHISVSFTIVNTRPLLMDLCERITPRYARYWREIGTLLDLSVKTLDIIELDHRKVRYCCNAMLETWLHIDPTASWRKLFTAIESCGVASRAPDKGMYSSCI